MIPIRHCIVVLHGVTTHTHLFGIRFPRVSAEIHTGSSHRKRTSHGLSMVGRKGRRCRCQCRNGKNAKVHGCWFVGWLVGSFFRLCVNVTNSNVLFERRVVGCSFPTGGFSLTNPALQGKEVLGGGACRHDKNCSTQQTQS